MFRRSGIDHYWPVPHKDTSIQTTFKRKWMLQFHPLVIQRGNEKFQFFWEGLHGNTRRKMIFTYFYCLNVPLVGPAKFRESIFIRNQTAHDRCAMVTSSASRIRISNPAFWTGQVVAVDAWTVTWSQNWNDPILRGFQWCFISVKFKVCYFFSVVKRILTARILQNNPNISKLYL